MTQECDTFLAPWTFVLPRAAPLAVVGDPCRGREAEGRQVREIPRGDGAAEHFDPVCRALQLARGHVGGGLQAQRERLRQRWSQADVVHVQHVRGSGIAQMALLREHPQDVGVALGLVAQLDADHHAPSADLLDNLRVTRAHGLERVEHLLAAVGAALQDVVLVEQLQCLQGDPAAEVVLGERGRVVERELADEPAPRDEQGADLRQPAAERLAQADVVGRDSQRFRREERAGASHAGLDFVDDNRDVVAGADVAQPCGEGGGERLDAAFAGDRFEEHGRHVFGVGAGGVEICGIVRVEKPHLGTHRVVGMAVGPGELDRADRLPVEAALDGPEHRTLAFEVDVLDGGFDGLGPGVRERHDVVADAAAQRLGQSRGPATARRLRVDRNPGVEQAARFGHQRRVMMAEQVGAVATEHVQHFHQAAVAPVIQVIALRHHIRGVEPQGFEQWNHRGAAEMSVAVHRVLGAPVDRGDICRLPRRPIEVNAAGVWGERRQAEAR